MPSWTLIPAPWARDWMPQDAGLVQDLLAAFQHPQHILKDDRRSLVLHLEQLPIAVPGETSASGGPWVCKRPRWRDGRGWNRLLSLFQEGEMRHAQGSAHHLLRLGLATPRPLLVLEGRSWGLLVESWQVYEFLPGEAVGVAEWPLIVKALSTMHEAGLAHGDPHLANWLRTEGGEVAALDPGPRPLRPGLADDAYDFILLRNCQPALAHLLPPLTPWKWRVAEARNAWTQAWRRFKRKLRRRA